MDLTEVLALMIPLGLVVVLPLTALFLHHQRKMAEMVRAQTQENDLSRQVAALRSPAARAPAPARGRLGPRPRIGRIRP